MPVIRWEEPGPEPVREEDGWAYAIAAELREQPGEWAVVLEIEAESAFEARRPVHALIDHDLWVELRWRGNLLTLYACWSKDKPEPSSSSATVYTFRKPGEARNEETVNEDDGTSPTETPAADLGHQGGKTRRRRWWQPR